MGAVGTSKLEPIYIRTSLSKEDRTGLDILPACALAAPGMAAQSWGAQGVAVEVLGSLRVICIVFR